MPFQVGDIVRLKSGGQKLTVSGIEGETIEVMYFEGYALHEAKIPAPCLILNSEVNH